MEIESEGFNEKDFLSFLYSNGKYKGAISRKEIKILLDKFKHNNNQLYASSESRD